MFDIDWNTVQEFYNNHTWKETLTTFKLSNHRLMSAKSQGLIKAKKRSLSDKYDWNLVQLDIDSGGSYSSISTKFGIPSNYIFKARKAGLIRFKSRSESLKMWSKKRGSLAGKANTTVSECQRREKIRRNVNSRYENGWQQSGGKCKFFKVSNCVGETFQVQGTWEKTFVEYLNDNGVLWRKNYATFPYTDVDGRRRLYIPDFTLPDYHEFVEVKGYETETDRYKWRSFPSHLTIVKKREIGRIRAKTFSPVGRDSNVSACKAVAQLYVG